VARLSRETAESQLAGTDPRSRIEAILSLALYDPDWRSTQDRCLELVHDPDRDIVATAILGLAHLARLHRQLDVARVLRELEPLSRDPALAGRVADALDDIHIFVANDRRDDATGGQQAP
jgi:hypothetical protein